MREREHVVVDPRARLGPPRAADRHHGHSADREPDGQPGTGEDDRQRRRTTAGCTGAAEPQGAERRDVVRRFGHPAAQGLGPGDEGGEPGDQCEGRQAHGEHLVPSATESTWSGALADEDLVEAEVRRRPVRRPSERPDPGGGDLEGGPEPGGVTPGRLVKGRGAVQPQNSGSGHVVGGPRDADDLEGIVGPAGSFEVVLVHTELLAGRTSDGDGVAHLETQFPCVNRLTSTS